MRPIVADGVVWSVGIMGPAKIAEPIEMLFGMWTWVGSVNHVLDWDARWRHD